MGQGEVDEEHQQQQRKVAEDRYEAAAEGGEQPVLRQGAECEEEADEGADKDCGDGHCQAKSEPLEQKIEVPQDGVEVERIAHRLLLASAVGLVGETDMRFGKLNAVPALVGFGVAREFRSRHCFMQ